MKKLLALALTLALLLSFTGCTSKNKDIKTAVNAVVESWEGHFEALGSGSKIEIVNTRVINIKENDNKHLSDIDFIVEFEIYSNYYTSKEGYLHNYGIIDSVNFYKDGTYKVMSTPTIDALYAETQNSEYVDCIDSVKNYGDKYNETYKFSR